MNTFLLLLLTAVSADDPVFSGPQKGEAAPGFKVLQLNGENALEEANPVGAWKDSAGLICFIHEITRPAAQLIRPLDAYGDENRERLKTLFVFLDDDLNHAERRLPTVIGAIHMKSPAGVSLDGLEGPGAYGLNRDVAMTVLVTRGGKVVGNWAIIQPNETDFPPIKRVLDELTGRLPRLETPAEMRAEILRLRDEVENLKRMLREIRQNGYGQRMDARRMDARRGAAGRRGNGDRARPGDADREGTKRAEGDRPAARFPGEIPDDARLTGYLRRLIRPDASHEAIDRTIAEIRAYIGDDASLHRQIEAGLDRVDHFDYGTEYSRRARQKLRKSGKKGDDGSRPGDGPRKDQERDRKKDDAGAE